ncbi:MAG: hypothetical protein LBM75_02560, partial [Myxococcales bacterium]|nr:hypothetical protein [Myxococcales bacterium]
MFLFATAAVLSVALGQYQPMEQNNSGQPESPINNYATQINNPASRLTTIHFLESPDKEPYSVTISGTNISCMAPCSLQGPPGFVEMDFRSGEDVYMKTIPIVGSTVNLTYRDQGSALAGGLWLGVGAGLSSALTIGGALLIHDSKVYNENYTKGFYYHDDQKVDGIVMVTIGSIGLLTSVITGSNLIHRYRTRVLQTDDQ